MDESKNVSPEYTRFDYSVIADGLDEPLQLDFDDKGRVYWIERGGQVKRADEAAGTVITLATLPLTDKEAPGLVGILIDREFTESNIIYLYYSAEEDNGNYMRLSQFLVDEESINLNSEQVLLKVYWEQPDGQHFGGGMTWDNDGNLILTIGCDTAPSQYGPYAFTNEGGRGQDSGRSAGNTNDLRGTIIRIRPEGDGNYSVPSGNLHEYTDSLTLPEIFVMGTRNPWRVSVDSETGYLHWGEVGPDAGMDSERFGPRGYDEFNVAKQAGNFGWPYLIGPNYAYNAYNYEDQLYGQPFSPEGPINISPNNTGLKILPPAQPALFYYPYNVSGEWPILGSAARSAVGGPVYREKDFNHELAVRPFPSYLEGKWLVTDYVRNWIMVVSMNDDRTSVLAIDPLLPAELLRHKQPLDLDFGPSGDLYIVEYGVAGQGKISKISYNDGNRAPVAMAGLSHSQEETLTAHFSSEGTIDYDGDKLKYQWTIRGEGYSDVIYKADHTYTFRSPGKYSAELTVQDPSGALDRATLDFVVGNRAPQVKINVEAGNQSFYFPGDRLKYQVVAQDEEDPTINSDSIQVSIEYIPSGIAPAYFSDPSNRAHRDPAVSISNRKAEQLVKKYNCISCHKISEPLVGPPYAAISERYRGNTGAEHALSRSITEGSVGQWGEAHMPPHPMLTEGEVGQLVEYILGLSSEQSNLVTLPLSGTYTIQTRELSRPVERLGKFYSFPVEPGTYLVRAKYADQGIDGRADLSLTGYDCVLLRYPILAPESADFKSEEGISFTPSTDDPGFIVTGNGGYIGFKDVDLTGIERIRVGAITRFWHWSHFIGGKAEIRVGTADGERVGNVADIIPPPLADGQGPFFGEASGKPVSFDVSALTGRHNVFIRIFNEDAADSDALVILTGVEFLQQ